MQRFHHMGRDECDSDYRVLEEDEVYLVFDYKLETVFSYFQAF